MKLMLNCKDVHEHASDYLDKRLSRRKRLTIWLHVMMCSHCRIFMKQLRLTIASVRSIHQQQDDDTKQLADVLHQRFLEIHKNKH